MWRFTADYHTHTRFSHGKGTVLQNVEAACQRGLTTLGIADHGPANWAHIGIRRISDYELLIAAVEDARRRFPAMTILAGAEANLIGYDGEIDIPQEYIGRLDQILVGFHTMIIPRRWSDGWRFIKTSVAARFGEKPHRMAREANTRALIAAVQRYPVKIITHPGLKIAIDSGKLARACAERGTALEINARHGIESIGFIRAAAESDVKFVLSSDAHSPREVGRLEPAAAAALQAGLPAERIINVEDRG